MGNSGTGARLLMGLLASHPLTSVVTGDASLTARPMTRVTEPLSQVGAAITTRPGGRLPATVIGAEDPMPIRYALPVASAQVKSAVLLAGLAAPGRTIVVETEPTRDHSEIMLRHFGAEVEVSENPAADGREIALTGQPELKACRLSVPGDPSSAAFPLVAGLILPDSELTLPGVCLNPHRSGLIETLIEMGAALTVANRRRDSGEEVGDLIVRSSSLQGIEVPAGRAPSMIDEYPILAVAAACAQGTTTMHGLGELRVKESDRLATVAQGLAACGVEVTEGPDSLTVKGCGGRPPGGNRAAIETRLDHRIAMSFLILGLASSAAVTIDDGGPMDTSFPGFVPLMTGLGAAISPA